MNQRKSPKSSRSRMKMKLDRISNLPSDVIEKILSHLPIREAVRTSVLSSKWRYKSAMLPHIVFDHQCVSTQNRRNYTTIANIVDHVLLGHIGPIHNFQLLSCNQTVASKDIDRWILHLSRNAIKELIIDIWQGSYYKTPSCLFSCQDLIHLELYKCLLKPPSTFKGFRSLKSLYIGGVTLAQDVFENLIVCSPLLERLTLIGCHGFTHLNIDAPNLQYLLADGVFEDVNIESTLNLADVFIYLDHNFDERRVPGSSSNLVKFIDHLPHIRILTIQNVFLKYLAVGALPEKLPKPCLHLKVLSIQISFTLDEILTALYLLRSSPALQELDIWANSDSEDVVEGVNFWSDDNQNCSFSQLRRVSIFTISGFKAELDFIKILLLSSPVLERMMVQPADYASAGIESELLRFRRVSARAEIIWDPCDSSINFGS